MSGRRARRLAAQRRRRASRKPGRASAARKPGRASSARKPGRASSASNISDDDDRDDGTEVMEVDNLPKYGMSGTNGELVEFNSLDEIEDPELRAMFADFELYSKDECQICNGEHDHDHAVLDSGHSDIKT